MLHEVNGRVLGEEDRRVNEKGGKGVYWLYLWARSGYLEVLFVVALINGLGSIGQHVPFSYCFHGHKFILKALGLERVFGGMQYLPRLTGVP